MTSVPAGYAEFQAATVAAGLAFFFMAMDLLWPIAALH
ncbi:hypothetical protein M770_13410 [Pseudomonas aeruginosa VRFPA03]|nr:hypothetical protein M770_13410 [Pseudomonas aeruginosa VRFPA03]